MQSTISCRHGTAPRVSEYLCSNIIKLPKDMLIYIQTLLVEKKYMFLYVLLSSKQSDESRNRENIKLSTCIYNSITYVRVFTELLWGNFAIPSNKEFQECLNPDKLLENKFEILKEISEYLFDSPNHFRTDIIWKGHKIGTKKRYSKYFVPNTFWNKSFSSLKYWKYRVCGCTPSCWRCREKCNKFQVKIGDRLLVKSSENGKYYRCIVREIKNISSTPCLFKHPEECICSRGDATYQSVREIYLIHNMECKGFDSEINIQILVELLPLPHEIVPPKIFQYVSMSEDLYYMANCYTNRLVWGTLNYSKMVMHKIYNIPFGWIILAKKEAKTALALI